MREARERGGLFFFFFQAEDGIRDLTVTGVQTCALPISEKMAAPGDAGAGVVAAAQCEHFLPVAHVEVRLLAELAAHGLGRRFARLDLPRSEERRVGKECGARWWPSHSKEPTAAMTVASA